jgi:hypothetical protein
MWATYQQVSCRGETQKTGLGQIVRIELQLEALGNLVALGYDSISGGWPPHAGEDIQYHAQTAGVHGSCGYEHQRDSRGKHDRQEQAND